MSIQSGDPWHTERLTIRKVRLGDAQAVFDSYASDPEVTRYLTWPTHTSVEDSRGFLRRALSEWDRPDGMRTYFIARRADGAAVGTIGFSTRGTTAEIGYAIGRSFWNQGYMTEVVSAFIATLIADPDIYRIQAIHDVDNPASGRVMEKAGMTFEGRLRRYSVHPNIGPEPRDALLYAVVR